MSVPDAARSPAPGAGAQDHVALRRSVRATLRHGTIVVIGGGCYGSWYVRQLARARDAGAITWERLIAVDRDEKCQLARSSHPPDFELVRATWSDFLSVFLGRAAEADPA